MDEQSYGINQIDQYLEAVRKQLSGISRAEVDSIIDDLREHIDASLQAQGGPPTRENVKAVLAKMDPPESFAPDLDLNAELVP